MRLSIKLAVTLSLCICLCSNAQELNIPVELQKRIAGKNRLEDIMQEVTAYYRQIKPGLLQAGNMPAEEAFEKNPYFQWVRWGTYMSSRTLDDGSLTNAYERTYREAMKIPNSPAGIQQQATTSVGNWSFIGPRTTSDLSPIKFYLGLGRVDRLAVAPSNPNIIYAGTPSGGLWRSINAGNSWLNTSAYLPSPGISGICVGRNNPDLVYILTGEGDTFFGGFVNSMGYTRNSVGVLKSTDGGVTWQETAPFPLAAATYSGFKLAIDPNNDNNLLAATTTGLYRTSDGGASWTQEVTGTFFDVEFVKNSSNIVFASGTGSNRFIRSTDGGQTWTYPNSWSPSTPGSHNRGEIAVAPSNQQVVYLILGPVVDTGVFRGVYKSVDQGSHLYPPGQHTQCTRTKRRRSGYQ